MLDLDRNGWLTDFDGLIDVFQRNFRSVTVVPYDAADVIPSLFDAMNVPLPPAYRALTLNRSVPIPAFNRFIMRRFGGFYHRRFRKGPVGAVWRGTKTLIWAVHDRCCASRRTRDG